MRAVVRSSGAGVVAVHVDGDNPHAVESVLLEDKAAHTVGVFTALIEELDAPIVERLVLDPGIAINYPGDYAAYTRMQMDMIRQAGLFRPLGRPLLVPIPRKRDIHWVSAYIALALEHRADIIRVHDVAIASELVRLWDRQPS
jgi:dihydropteroate synthase